MGDAMGPDEGRGHVRRQEVVAPFGQRALSTDEPRTLMDDATAAAVDGQFRFTHINERAAELLQAPVDALIGEKLPDRYPEAAAVDEVRDTFHTAMNEQVLTSDDLYCPPLWVEADLYPSESGVSVYSRGVTGRKEREQERRNPIQTGEKENDEGGRHFLVHAPRDRRGR